MPYLYGASIPGIQGFIYETNMLREIAGASELVEDLCNRNGDVSSFLKKHSLNDVKWLLNAAGNIRFTTDDERLVQILVEKWPATVAAKAPGITINQAVIKYQGELSGQHLDELECRLRVQRNKTDHSDFQGLMAIERSRRTGKPAVEWKDDGLWDAGIRAKHIEAAKDVPRSLMRKIIPEGWAENTKHYTRFPFEMSDIIGNSESSWIAVIHADGNNLGRIIRSVTQCAGAAMQKVLSKFSDDVSGATLQAVQDAFSSVIEEPNSGTAEGKYPVRPVVIGGDDITIICRSDLALSFTESFLSGFRKHTTFALEPLVKEYNLNILDQGLTACAGIAFVKDSYPFHYAVELATGLCDFAKKSAKKANSILTPSCLMFHKVHSSFVDDFEAIVKRELNANGVRFDYGPYYLADEGPEGAPTIRSLIENAESLNLSGSPRSGLRQWLTSLHRSRRLADQDMERLKVVHPEFVHLLDQAVVKREDIDYAPAYDWLVTASLIRGGD